jgi:PadR family transcriptional regulator, regulatory protein PadR
MTDRSYLGEFELMILLAILHLGDQAYGVPIARELERHRGREVSIGSIYAALERLETKGLIASSLGDPTPERGGKAKRYFRVNREGMRQVNETRRVLTSLWKQVPQWKGEGI